MLELKIEVTSNLNLNKDWNEIILKHIDRGMEEAALQIFNISQDNFQNYVHPPIDSGQLLNSAKIESKFLEKIIRYKCKYAKYVEYGTAPHMPPLEPIMAWVYNKRSEFNLPKRIKRLDKRIKAIANKIRWKIFHHGTIGKPFLRPAFFIVKHRLSDILQRHLNNALKEIKG